MAKNYTFGEAVKTIAEGKDLEAIADIGRRYPVLACKVAIVAAKAGNDFVDLMSFLPEYLTANKVNSAIKSGITESAEDEGSEKVKDTDEAKANEEDVIGPDTDFDSMSGRQLWEILGKAGKRKVAKSAKKADLIEACKIVFGGKTDDETSSDDSEVEEDNSNPYEGKSAMELFKECKARKLKAEPKKPAKYYVNILTKDDEEKEKSNESVEAESDDWDDDEPEAKSESKKATTKGRKSTKNVEKAEEEADDDDDWDI